MEFIQKMKKREYIEMGLKTLAGLLAAFIAIILMEGMIYGITLNSYMNNGTTQAFHESSTVAYCIEVDDDKYFVLTYNPTEDEDDKWSGMADTYLTKAECEALKVADIKYHAPSAFDFTINGVHYVVIALFVTAVIGFFVYRFVKLTMEYKKIEDEFNKTGAIEISNM